MTSKTIVVPAKHITGLDKATLLSDIDAYGYPNGTKRERLIDSLDAISVGRNDSAVEYLEECLQDVPWFDDGWLLYLIIYTDYLRGSSILQKQMRELAKTCPKDIKPDFPILDSDIDSRFIKLLIDKTLNFMYENGLMCKQDVDILRGLYKNNQPEGIIRLYIQKAARKNIKTPNGQVKCEYWIQISTPAGHTPEEMPCKDIEGSTQHIIIDDKTIEITGKFLNIAYMLAYNNVYDFYYKGKDFLGSGWTFLDEDTVFNNREYKLLDVKDDINKMRNIFEKHSINRFLIENKKSKSRPLYRFSNNPFQIELDEETIRFMIKKRAEKLYHN